MHPESEKSLRQGQRRRDRNVHLRARRPFGSEPVRHPDPPGAGRSADRLRADSQARRIRRRQALTLPQAHASKSKTIFICAKNDSMTSASLRHDRLLACLAAAVFGLLTVAPVRAAAECPATEKVEGGDYCNFIAK